MIEIGKTARLIILREADQGFYLDGENLGEILLPNRYVPVDLEQGDEITVFLYPDSEDRLVATTEEPLCEADEFAALRVVEVHPTMGAFLDWGLPKDLLLPYREQMTKVRAGQLVVARVLVDLTSGRMIATTRIDRFLKNTGANYEEGDEVSLLVYRHTPMGFNALADRQHPGLLYHSELAEPLNIGQMIRGFVREIRPGGNLDFSLQRSGYERVDPLAEQILRALQESGGRLGLGDRSSPAEIREVFGTSKKAFKQALGALYKKRLIRLSADEIQSV
jgi:predicted RNA-binding protein (virulence factor B family)